MGIRREFSIRGITADFLEKRRDFLTVQDNRLVNNGGDVLCFLSGLCRFLRNSGLFRRLAALTVFLT
ncbi:MAG: hypothetical protein IJ252_15950 [Solobacterium sp.]|nr:hypothetical protein [Solobacterium sp.]